jgi:hypothetical protein
MKAAAELRRHDMILSATLAARLGWLALYPLRRAIPGPKGQAGRGKSAYPFRSAYLGGC